MRETVLDLGSTSSNITTDKDLLKIIELCYNKKPLSKQPTTQEKIMVTALVLLNIERQHIKDISQKLVNMPEVSEVYSVAGRYDLVAIVRVKTNEQIAETIAEKFGELNGITASETLIAFNTFSRHDLELMFSIGE